MLKNSRLIHLIMLVLVLNSCRTESKLEEAINKIDVDLNIERFDRRFAEAEPDDLPRLKEDYPFLFSKQFPDSLWIERMQDSLQKQLHAEVGKSFDSFKEEQAELVRFFQHLKYYNETFRMPRVITVTSDVDYRNKIIVTDTIVLIALDTYLGKDHEFYSGIQRYLRKNFVKEQLVVDLSSAYGKREIMIKRRRTLLDDMINSGKVLYFNDIMLPFKTEAERIGYTQEELEWATANESYIWRHFVEKELLYSTDPKLAGYYIDPAPFTKFGLELDSESPGRLGQYIGWQIVRAYMENNKVNYREMMRTSPEELFNESKFKPRR